MPLNAATHVQNAKLSFDGNVLFSGIDLALADGQWTCLLGKSGVGKSSLLRLIAGLEETATADALSVAGSAGDSGKIAYMAQQDLLFPWATLAENVCIGDRLRGVAARSGIERAKGLLDRLGLADTADFYPSACSGGMRQRAALARTLYEDRDVVLMDEPFSAVDAITRLELQALAAEVLAGKTVLLVTHDPWEALRLGDHILVMTGRPARLHTLDDLPAAPPLRSPADPGMTDAHERLLSLIGKPEVPEAP